MTGFRAQHTGLDHEWTIKGLNYDTKYGFRVFAVNTEVLIKASLPSSRTSDGILFCDMTEISTCFLLLNIQTVVVILFLTRTPSRGKLAHIATQLKSALYRSHHKLRQHLKKVNCLLFLDVSYHNWICYGGFIYF